MTDLYIRADTEAAMAETIPWARAADEPGAAVWLGTGEVGGERFDLDVIGPVVSVPAAYDGSGNVVTAAVMDERFHANMRCTPAIAALVPGAIVVAPDPATPTRRFA